MEVGSMPRRMFRVTPSPSVPVSLVVASLEVSSLVSDSSAVLLVSAVLLSPEAVEEASSLPQAANTVHTIKTARTKAKIFLSFILDSP